MSTDPTADPIWPEGHRLIRRETVDSTMAEAARIAANITAPTWIMAGEQTAARGRHGRNWVQRPGNLATTLVFHPACTPQEGALRSFLASYALFEALALSVPRSALALKWPNDVLLNGGKVAGILLEASGQGPYMDWLAIGFGVNLAYAPHTIRDAAFPPISLADAGGEVPTPESFIARLAADYATQEAKLDAFGFDRVREDWLRQAARLGEIITARTSREEITGKFTTIDADGNLVLETAAGLRAIPAADVYF